jgi:O-antigen ligase
MSRSVAEHRFEPVLVYSATPGRGAVRWTVLVALGLAPLAIGCGYPAGYVPLLAILFAAGGYSLYREARLRREGVAVPPLPGDRPLLALTGLVAFQLLPLPPPVLKVLSPGSFAFYNDRLLVPLKAWKPITASPADTLRGLIFLTGMSLLYRTVHREFDQPLWRRRLVKAVIGAGLVMTVEALVQQAYSANLIYGVWRPRWDWAVFGPYVNKNFFAGYMVMAVALGIALCAESLDRLRHAWGRRRRRAWLALGDAEGSVFFQRATVAMVLLTGLLATGSRGGLLGFAAAGAALAFASRRRATLVALVLVAALGVTWIGLSAHWSGFLTRGLQGRAEVWRDCLRMIPDHPVFGAGFNAFGTSYLAYQTVWRTHWIPAAHSEYLQIVVDLGIAGAAIAVALLWTLLRQAGASSRQDALHAGLFAGVVAVLAHNLVDFNWHLAANSATFVALAGVGTQGSGAAARRLDPPPRHA